MEYTAASWHISLFSFQYLRTEARVTVKIKNNKGVVNSFEEKRLLQIPLQRLDY